MRTPVELNTIGERVEQKSVVLVGKKVDLRHPGIEPGASRWQRDILPLNQRRGTNTSITPISYTIKIDTFPPKRHTTTTAHTLVRFFHSLTPSFTRFCALSPFFVRLRFLPGPVCPKPALSLFGIFTNYAAAVFVQ